MVSQGMTSLPSQKRDEYFVKITNAHVHTHVCMPAAVELNEIKFTCHQYLINH
jgi:hypothetical protein